MRGHKPKPSQLQLVPSRTPCKRAVLAPCQANEPTPHQCCLAAPQHCGLLLFPPGASFKKDLSKPCWDQQTNRYQALELKATILAWELKTFRRFALQVSLAPGCWPDLTFSWWLRNTPYPQQSLQISAAWARSCGSRYMGQSCADLSAARPWAVCVEVLDKGNKEHLDIVAMQENAKFQTNLD